MVDQEYGHHLLKHLVCEEKGRFQTPYQNQNYWVEAFDEPLIVQQVDRIKGDKWDVLFPYEFKSNFELDSLSLDEWDRFHGLTVQGVPFVFSRAAQSEFFHLLDDYDDTSITVGHRHDEVPDWLVGIPVITKGN